MPTHHRCRLDDDQSVKGARTNSIEPHKNQPICGPQEKLSRGPTQGNGKLVAKDGILGLKARPRLEKT
jgi:hypothetical protein